MQIFKKEVDRVRCDGVGAAEVVRRGEGGGPRRLLISQCRREMWGLGSRCNERWRGVRSVNAVRVDEEQD